MTHISGKPIKVEAAAPSTFPCIDVENDIEDWLEQVRENCMFGQVDQSHGVASGFLGGEPKSQSVCVPKLKDSRRKPERKRKCDRNAAEIPIFDHFFLKRLRIAALVKLHPSMLSDKNYVLQQNIC